MLKAADDIDARNTRIVKELHELVDREATLKEQIDTLDVLLKRAHKTNRLKGDRIQELLRFNVEFNENQKKCNTQRTKRSLIGRRVGIINPSSFVIDDARHVNEIIRDKSNKFANASSNRDHIMLFCSSFFFLLF